MGSFHIEYYPRAKKDLEKVNDSREAVKIIDEIERQLSISPFPNPPRKKKIQGISSPLYRLRIDTGRDSYRVFYTFQSIQVVILRVVKKKDADKIIKSFR